MKALFNIENPFWSFVARLVDVIILHIIWVVTCIPIVTFGTATISLYYVMMKEARDEGTHFIRLYFRSFKQNFKQGIVAGLSFLVIVALLLYTLYFYSINLADMGMSFVILRILNFVILGVVLATYAYLFPLLARFENTLWKSVKNALFMAFANLGWTILMLVMFFGFYYLIYRFAFYPALILGFGFLCFIYGYIMNHIFKPFVDEQEPKDDWIEGEAAEVETQEGEMK